eukprot:TRINITY_DN1037_c0_g1_i1.p1 TRINITY_DN1037_c0_g1~~TRINITY_DN1037_c0_g1_i1.p1  ORF type:complete len:182 (-),score=1.92 TRINITY_DN1037_c0_g1_i1:99-644(-)
MNTVICTLLLSLLNLIALWQHNRKLKRTACSLLFSTTAHIIQDERRLLFPKLTARSRLALVLEFLRRHPPQSLLAQRYGISQSTVSRELHHSIPILYIYCRFINWPERPITESWCNAIGNENLFDFLNFFEFFLFSILGAIDCTSHFRCRVHPGQALYYRGDKHGHFITAQVKRLSLISKI